MTPRRLAARVKFISSTKVTIATEIPELAKKVFVAAKIMRTSDEDQELSLEFTDGTSFSYSCSSKVVAEVSVYRGGVGEKEIIRGFKVGG